MFKDAVKIGTPVAMGTDAGVEPHGLNAKEFSLMASYGMPADQVLMAGTANGAELLGIADQDRHIDRRQVADIVAVPGNPLTNISATEKVTFVMQAGRVIKNQGAH